MHLSKIRQFLLSEYAQFCTAKSRFKDWISWQVLPVFREPLITVLLVLLGLIVLTFFILLTLMVISLVTWTPEAK